LARSCDNILVTGGGMGTGRTAGVPSLRSCRSAVRCMWPDWLHPHTSMAVSARFSRLSGLSRPKHFVGIAQSGRQLRDPAWGKRFCLHSIQNCLVAHPASYLMGTGSFVPWSKAAGTRGSPLTSTLRRGWEYMELYYHSLIRLHGVVHN
jgi:hypothetical protein